MPCGRDNQCDHASALLRCPRRGGLRPSTFFDPAPLFFFEPRGDRPVESHCTLVAPYRRSPGELGRCPCMRCLPGGVRATAGWNALLGPVPRGCISLAESVRLGLVWHGRGRTVVDSDATALPTFPLTVVRKLSSRVCFASSLRKPTQTNHCIYGDS